MCLIAGKEGKNYRNYGLSQLGRPAAAWQASTEMIADMGRAFLAMVWYFRRQRSEVRGRKSEVGSQKTEVRNQKSKVRNQKSA